MTSLSEKKGWTVLDAVGGNYSITQIFSFWRKSESFLNEVNGILELETMVQMYLKKGLFKLAKYGWQNQQRQTEVEISDYKEPGRVRKIVLNTDSYDGVMGLPSRLSNHENKPTIWKLPYLVLWGERIQRSGLDLLQDNLAFLRDKEIDLEKITNLARTPAFDHYIVLSQSACGIGQKMIALRVWQPIGFNRSWDVNLGVGYVNKSKGAKFDYESVMEDQIFPRDKVRLLIDKLNVNFQNR